jgi:hypothetical protein
VVASKFFPIDGPDGKPYPLCERDYFRRLNLICAKCDQALRGSYITACSTSISRFHAKVNADICLTHSSFFASLYRQEISRRALHLLAVRHALWPAGLVLRARGRRLLSLPLLDPVRHKMCGMLECDSQAVRGDQSQQSRRVLASRVLYDQQGSCLLFSLFPSVGDLQGP